MLCLVVSDSLRPPWAIAPSSGLFVHGDSPGKNTGVGCHALLQGIFPTQGSNPGIPHCRQILHKLSNQGSPVKFIYISFFIFFSNMVYYKILNVVICAIQWDFVATPGLDPGIFLCQIIYSDQIRSVAQSCRTFCDPMNRSTPGLPVHHQPPEFTKTHVH